ncbi:preprotein translocase subunit SecA [Candidatus Phytoplasma melaleucae]|uniref:Protein translocase subunit SecA n=1 Tax=Candidatus Phytoplasma melaleucae TaxID=2982630 RepID=A0ABT9DE59_9MOLU|nr:preprotein translocase subunit SecA ['Melaleuca sp.' phytoplasma]MDO8167886.1 preprotein translocase subunit SecA ['Melaleuca sp.' phytoplasma]MDV3205207.1 preprotein translocase subunit SecA [Weeping tea tree witches'-broom phytoplasma]
MWFFVKSFFASSHKHLKSIRLIAHQIEQLSDIKAQLKDQDFPRETERLKKLIQEGVSLDELLVEAFALVREASKRVTKLTPYYVQLLGAIILHQGHIAEMKTGEGKTLTSVMPAYLNALSGKSVHIVTVNEYLARREAEGAIGDIFRFLGMSVGLNTKNQSIQQKKIAYNCDILYSTNSELGFDYLRDNMESDISNVLMKRNYDYVIIDEVDSILIDEARTPLIISDNIRKGRKFYRDADRFAKSLKSDHYIIDLESRTIELTEEGIKKAESFFKISNFYSNDNALLLHFIKNALKACFIMERNKDYLVDKEQILIIDQFTGRILIGRQFSDGLHQALEAKERCPIKEETEISALITYQNLFRIYNKISGMTGTAKTEEKEFFSIYGMKVIEIPTNKLMIREDAQDLVFLTLKDKWQALLADIEIRHAKQQPILIGTVTVEVSEEISKYLRKRRIPHEVLNAKNHEKESEIIAKAGRKGSVTIATNMAGRGTDICLGEGVVELGGLAVLGTERHEVRRIDNQLRGRAGRQGDPGYSQFFVSAEDELVKRFGASKIAKLISLLQTNDKNKNNISSQFLTNLFTNIQKKIESSNFEYRKFVLQFDSVLKLQREIIYQQRKDILVSHDVEKLALTVIQTTLNQKIRNFFSNKNNDKSKCNIQKLIDYLEMTFFPKNTFSAEEFDLKTITFEEVEPIIARKTEYLLQKQKNKLIILGEKHYSNMLRLIMLINIDNQFKSHINDMNVLRKSISFLSYGQQNILTVYQNEGQKFFNQMIENISINITKMILKFSVLNNMLTSSLQSDLMVEPPVKSHEQYTKRKRNIRNMKKPWN